MKRKLMYVGCLGYSNLGDEACLEGFRALIDDLLPGDWELVVVNGYDFKDDMPFDALVLGGGTLLSPHGNLGDAAMIEARRRGAPAFIFGTGLESLDWENRPSDEQLADFRRLVSEAVSIAVRGTRSKDYLTEIGIAGDRIKVIGDLAVALPSPPKPTLEKRQHRLAVNVGTSFGRVFGRDESRMVTTLVEALNEIAPGVGEIHFIPVWDRDIPVQREVASRLTAAAAVVEHTELADINDLIAQLAGMDSLIAMKLHAGIFSAVANTPYLPWSYRPKVEDFAGEIGLSEFVVRTNAPAGRLVESWRKLVADPGRVRAVMAERLDAMRARLREHSAELVHAIAGSPDGE